MKLRLIVWLALLAGCGDPSPPDEFGVNLTVSAHQLSAEQIAAIKTFGVVVTGDLPDPYERTLDVSTALAGAEVRAHYVPKVMSGTLSFAVQALDSTAMAVAAGSSGDVELVAGRGVAAMVELVGVTDTDAGTDASADGGMEHCANGSQDPSETDVDCGGPDCPACAIDKHCAESNDCETATCVGGSCVAAFGPPNWVPVVDMPIARQAACGAVTPDGRVLAISGYTNSLQATALVHAYDPNANAWSTAPSLPNPQPLCAAATTSAGEVVVAGGSVQSGSIFNSIAVVEMLAPGATSWTDAPMLKHSRTGAASAVGPDGKVYVMGGNNGGSSLSGQTPPLAFVERFEGNTWTDLAPFTARVNLAAALGMDGRIYALGGGGAATVESYSAGTNAWMGAPPMMKGRKNLCAASAPDGRIYAIGGADASTVATAAVEVFSTITGQWTTTAALAKPRAGLAAVVGGDGRIYAFGGVDAMTGAEVKTVEAYGPVVTLSKTSGAAGSGLSISGSNFAANARVDVFFGPLTQPSATGITDGTGLLQAPIAVTVPTLAAGSYSVRVRDSKSLYPVTKTFVIQ
jgi:hypothetical protein